MMIITAIVVPTPMPMFRASCCLPWIVVRVVELSDSAVIACDVVGGAVVGILPTENKKNLILNKDKTTTKCDSSRYYFGNILDQLRITPTHSC